MDAQPYATRYDTRTSTSGRQVRPLAQPPDRGPWAPSSRPLDAYSPSTSAIYVQPGEGGAGIPQPGDTVYLDPYSAHMEGAHDGYAGSAAVGGPHHTPVGPVSHAIGGPYPWGHPANGPRPDAAYHPSGLPAFRGQHTASGGWPGGGTYRGNVGFEMEELFDGDDDDDESSSSSDDDENDGNEIRASRRVPGSEYTLQAKGLPSAIAGSGMRFKTLKTGTTPTGGEWIVGKRPRTDRPPSNVRVFARHESLTLTPAGGEYSAEVDTGKKVAAIRQQILPAGNGAAVRRYAHIGQ